MSKGATRRGFLAGAAAGGASLLRGAAARPNILWITCEDMSPILGCYGDRYAYTPNLDRLAAEGVRFTRAFATSSVCTPVRSCLAAGVFANALGTMHLRGPQPLPRGMNVYSAWLRRAGYYCTNNVKEDYNFTAPPDAWDESSGKAHWRGRKPGQPFFAIFNLMTTHQGQIRYPREQFEEISRKLPAEARHDPARAPLPPYYPDTPDVRLHIAALYTQATLMDQQAGELLAELRDAGLADDTIVFFYSDHGSGIPRHKRWLHDSGTQAPFLVRFPPKFRSLAPAPPGSVVDRLISFEDFPPTVLALAGVEPPAHMTGRVFLGPRAARPREYVFAAGDRVDEVIECSRAVRDRRFLYIRNYLPHRPRMQRSDYSEVGHIRKELRRLHAEGKLRGDQAWLMAPSKPAEELYDCDADPHQMRNLAGASEHQATLKRLRAELRAWILRTRDTGFLPEDDMARRAGGGSPYEIPKDKFPLERILDTAELVGRGRGHVPELGRRLADPDPAVRYWAAVGLLALKDAARPAAGALRKALKDEAPAVRIAAAEALANTGGEREALPVLGECVKNPDARVALQAAVALGYLGAKARPALADMEQAAKEKGGPEEQRQYTGWSLKATLAALAK